MRIIITGGGSGGHIYPGIALADRLKSKGNQHQILFVGASGKMEMQVVPAAGYAIQGLSIRSVERKGKRILKNLYLPFRLLVSLWQARKIIKTFQPDIVVGTGGYASFPVVYMAARFRIPIVLQEQNAYPGLATRLLARYAAVVCVAYEGMDRYFPASQVVLTGNPIRQSFLPLPARQAALAYFGLSPDYPTLLVLGGSLGAPAINQTVMDALSPLVAHGWQVVIVTGQAYFSRIADRVPLLPPQVKVVPYIKEMNQALAAADMVVSRGGAMAIAEIAVAGKPVIFVPSPHVAADHQTKNVLPLVEQGAGLLVKEQEVHTHLIPAIVGLMYDAERRQQLALKIRKYAKPHAAATIVDLLKKLHQSS